MSDKHWRQVGHAMSEQLDRVNGRDGQAGSFGHRVPPTRAESVLQRQLEDMRQELRRLERQVTSRDEVITALRQASGDPSVVWRNGRPCITPAQAAQKTGLSVSQISRYCATRWWQVEQDETGHWWIYSDQPLARKERGRKGKRNQ